MKKPIEIVIVFFIMSICLFSCTRKRQEEKTNDEKSSYEIPKLKIGVSASGQKEDYCDCYQGNIDYQIYTFQGCEYIKFGTGRYSWGAHSGVCPNPIHRYSPETISSN